MSDYLKDRDAGGYVLEWGKYRGNELAHYDVPYEYLYFVRDKGNRDFRAACKNYLDGLMDDCGNARIEYGKKHRNQTLNQVRDKKWAKWMLSTPWLKEHKPFLRLLILEWLKVSYRREEVVRDHGVRTNIDGSEPEEDSEPGEFSAEEESDSSWIISDEEGDSNASFSGSESSAQSTQDASDNPDVSKLALESAKRAAKSTSRSLSPKKRRRAPSSSDSSIEILQSPSKRPRSPSKRSPARISRPAKSASSSDSSSKSPRKRPKKVIPPTTDEDDASVTPKKRAARLRYSSEEELPTVESLAPVISPRRKQASKQSRKNANSDSDDHPIAKPRIHVRSETPLASTLAIEVPELRSPRKVHSSWIRPEYSGSEREEEAKSPSSRRKRKIETSSESSEDG